MTDETTHAGTTVELRHVEGYVFTVHLDGRDEAVVRTDEPPPIGSGNGPNPEALLTAAIVNCLCSSFLFCARKAHLDIRDLRGSGTARIGRNERGRLRIQGVRVRVTGSVPPEQMERVERCRAIFEDYCTVTGSVRAAIPVDVSLEIAPSTAAAPASE